ncbi:hypothetical protein ACFY05_33020 [Microtetraspora fusca]|uniref:Uncharacterized protein n=1 Tax=Microtetraspora fusca TaxID=1997 RepID=A0ABW6VE72_MICFU
MTTPIPAPPLPIDPQRAVQTITGIHSQAKSMIARHWQRTIENLPDQGHDDRRLLQDRMSILKAAGADIEPLVNEWQERWDAYQRDGGTLEFTPIAPA